MSTPSPTLAGLLRYREVWLPTWRGGLLLLLLLGAAVAGFLYGILPFLAPLTPRTAGAMVVEGWVDNPTLRRAAEEFRTRHFTALYSTGQPIESESPHSAYGTYADYGAERLHTLGLAEALAVPGSGASRDRTYSSAISLRDWLRAHGGVPADLTVLTEGPHGRRSWLLFQKAFGPDVRVGVISVPRRDYDPHQWWNSSAGFCDTLGEATAYLYARLLFREGEAL